MTPIADAFKRAARNKRGESFAEETLKRANQIIAARDKNSRFRTLPEPLKRPDLRLKSHSA